MTTTPTLRDIPWTAVTDAFAFPDDPGRVPVWQRADGVSVARVIDRDGQAGTFMVERDGEVLSAPRGHAKDFRPGRMPHIAAAAEHYLGLSARTRKQLTDVIPEADGRVRIIQSDLEAIARHRHGPDPLNFAFTCMFCGDVAAIGEFVRAGVDGGRAGQECIGRHLGALDQGYTGRGCLAVAYGLIPGPWEVFYAASDDGTVKSMRTFAVADQPKPTSRPWTAPVKTTTGTRRTTKRACNGCSLLLGDVTDAEIQAGVAGQPLPDVMGECPACSKAATA